jgi:hypothetical protein
VEGERYRWRVEGGGIVAEVEPLSVLVCGTASLWIVKL